MAYLLGITDIDLCGSDFFLNFLILNGSLPDFDIDFCMRRRGKVIEYVREKYGRDCGPTLLPLVLSGQKW